MQKEIFDLVEEPHILDELYSEEQNRRIPIRLLQNRGTIDEMLGIMSDLRNARTGMIEKLHTASEATLFATLTSIGYNFQAIGKKDHLCNINGVKIKDKDQLIVMMVYGIIEILALKEKDNVEK